MKLVITGVTGFVGSYTLPLLAKKCEKIWALVRPASIEGARKKWSSKLKNVEFIPYDLVSANPFGENGEHLDQMLEATDLFHMAALYDLEAEATDLHMANIFGTQNILSLADLLPSLKRFHHLSTIAVAGDFRGNFKESMFNVGQRFSDDYAKTKYRAEGLVGSWRRTDVKRYVYRLGVVVGNSTTGEMPKIDGPYYLFDSINKHHKIWKLMARAGKIPLPFSQNASIPLIQVNIAAQQLSTLVTNPCLLVDSQFKTYHVVGTQVPIRKIFERTLIESGLNIIPIAAPRFLFPRGLLSALSIPKELVDYMYAECVYDTTNLNNDFPKIENPGYEVIALTLFSSLRKAT
jgi:thioester reductase-like protein